jgi:hypothetical protein
MHEIFGREERNPRKSKEKALGDPAGAIGSVDTPAPDDIASEINPKDATSEVWSGDDRKMAETFKVCLREVGFNCVLIAGGGRQRVLVVPAAESLAPRKLFARLSSRLLWNECERCLTNPRAFSTHLNRR